MNIINFIRSLDYTENLKCHDKSWVYGKNGHMKREHIYIYRKSQLTWIESALTSLAQLLKFSLANMQARS